MDGKHDLIGCQSKTSVCKCASGVDAALTVSRSISPQSLDDILLARVVQRMDNAIHRLNHYPVDSVVCFVETYPLDSDLSSG